MSTLISVCDLSFWYEADAMPIVFRMNFEVRPATITAVVGRSGCGKSTLLRLLSGLIPTSLSALGPGQTTKMDGRIVMDGRDITQPRRDCAYVPQNYGNALLPGRSALDNITMNTGRPQATRGRALKLLREVGISAQFAGVPAARLSGGQRQRVVLCRALLQQPRVLFLDEPFSSLDTTLTPEMGTMLLRLRDQHGIGSVLVTHDISSAVKIADRIVAIRRTHTLPQTEQFSKGEISSEGVERWIAARGF